LLLGRIGFALKRASPTLSRGSLSLLIENTGEADEDKVDRYDIVEKFRDHKNEDTGDQGD
jgi:hypothetical protein